MGSTGGTPSGASVRVQDGSMQASWTLGALEPRRGGVLFKRVRERGNTRWAARAEAPFVQRHPGAAPESELGPCVFTTGRQRVDARGPRQRLENSEPVASPFLQRTLSRQHKPMRTLRFKANSAVGSALAAPRVVAYATAEIENVALTERVPGCSGTTTTVMPVRERVHRALPVPGAAAVLAWRELAFSFLRQPFRGRSGCMYATRSCT